jgi:histidine triad (HIT) family protein
MTVCPFCKMISGELDATFIYQDQYCSALMSMHPVNPGHVLLIPNDHITRLDDLPQEAAQDFFQVSQHLAGAVRASGVQCDGINIYLADGKAAGQEIAHIQLHIIPRFENDGFELSFSSRSAELPTREELDNNAYHIRQALTDTDPLD